LLSEHSLFNAHLRFWGYMTSSALPLGALAGLLAAAHAYGRENSSAGNACPETQGYDKAPSDASTSDTGAAFGQDDSEFNTFTSIDSW